VSQLGPQGWYGSEQWMLPEEPGTYVLILRLPEQATIRVGKLGVFPFPAGWYAYVGSARGPGGLAARVSRHCRRSKRHHWHIDYLRPQSELIAVWYTLGPQKQECKWAEALSDLPDTSFPVSRFGASDCHCSTHLIHFPTRPDLSAYRQLVREPVSERLLPT